MNYTPAPEAEEKAGKSYAEGEYSFTVTVAKEVTFKTGSSGAELEFALDVGNGKTIRNFARLVYAKKAQWKVKEFLECLGLDFHNSPPIDQLVGLKGKAYFEPAGEKGYLEAKSYLPRDPSLPPVVLEPPQDWSKVGPPAVSDDDVPF